MAAEKEAFPEVRHPLEFLEGHHDRQRLICVALERLAADPAADDAAETARMILDYFERELPLHIADEEQDLFPAMQERCDEDDGFDEMMTMLEEEHETDMDLHDRLVPMLQAIAEQRAGLQPYFSHDATAFATLQRRHLAWENGAVLPLARRTLTEADIEAMAKTMTARRRGA